ncbi:hypothetical protein [Tunturiibacter lichenicola]|uniref:hypothetical protein n=1 Tax=Tunturiibacter lichenicola TaxID=2051959 RepID=UPI003D9B1481
MQGDGFIQTSTRAVSRVAITESVQQRTTPRIASLIGFLLFSTVTARPQRSDDQTVLLKIGWTNIELSQPSRVTLSGCLLVLSDGSFHMEKRSQVLPERTATLKILEGVETTEQLSKMKALLEDKIVVNLPDYQFPAPPLASSSIEAVKAEIFRGKTVQKIRYAIWKDQDKNDSVDGKESADKQVEVKAALFPLLQWKDSLQGTEIDDPDPQSLGCSFEN